MAPRTATAERPAAPEQKPATSQQSHVQPGQALTTSEKAKQQHPIVAFKAYMDQRMSEISLALPPQISPDRFARVVLTALQRKPDLLKCTKQSLFNACMLAAQDGLLPDGREGAIAPYGESEGGKRVAEIATWMPMVEGLRKKARNSGELSDWMVRVANARDKFQVILGDDEKIIHEPYIGPDDPGEIVAAYSIARLKDGTVSREVMTLRDIEKIKAKSKAKNGPWSDATFFPEMCKKTVARRHYKQLPHSSDLDAMIERDDQAFGLDDRTDDQIEQRQARRLASTAAAFDEFGKAPVIEHEADELSNPQKPDSGIDGEFDDDAAQPQGGAQPAGEQQGSGETETKAPGAKEPAKTPDKPAEPEKPAAWSLDQVPKTPEEYERYAAAYLPTQTDGEAISTWFKGEEQRKLRNACNVTKEVFDAVKLVASRRIAELRKS